MKDKPWVTSALKRVQSSRVKNNLYKKWIKTRTILNETKYKN